MHLERESSETRLSSQTSTTSLIPVFLGVLGASFFLKRFDVADPIKRVYWDACAWIARIQREKITDPSGKLIEDREAVCQEVIVAAEARKLEIATSALSLAEVCKNPGLRTEGEDKIAGFFENEYILLTNVDRFVGERARLLMMSGYSRLKPPDAIHLASAALSNADEMHTFDDGLLKLDGLIDKADGNKLAIKKPNVGATSLPLLDLIEQRKPKPTDQAG